MKIFFAREVRTMARPGCAVGFEVKTTVIKPIECVLKVKMTKKNYAKFTFWNQRNFSQLFPSVVFSSPKSQPTVQTTREFLIVLLDKTHHNITDENIFAISVQHEDYKVPLQCVSKVLYNADKGSKSRYTITLEMCFYFPFLSFSVLYSVPRRILFQSHFPV